MATDLAKVAKEKGIKYFLISFSDMFGVARSKLVPARAIKEMQKDGAGFAGFAAWLDMTPAHPDMFAVPDPDSLIQLPWKPEVGWLASDLWMDGKEVEASPRVMLKRQIAAAKKMGYVLKTGVECEYHLIAEDGSDIADPRDIQEKPCYDQAALMRRYDVISRDLRRHDRAGLGPVSERPRGRQRPVRDELGLRRLPGDRGPPHLLQDHGPRRSPRSTACAPPSCPNRSCTLTGNGCHCHASLWDKTGKKCLFDGDDEHGMSPLAYNFLGGVLHSAEALCALFNPTVNSYKRINAPRTTSGATWAPNTVTYGGNNRTHMVRIPDAGRFEFRLMDGAANPYLLQAGVLAAGLEGIKSKRDPGKRLDIDMYADGHKVRGAKKLPLNMLDAGFKAERRAQSVRLVSGGPARTAVFAATHGLFDRQHRRRLPEGIGFLEPVSLRQFFRCASHGACSLGTFG